MSIELLLEFNTSLVFIFKILPYILPYSKGYIVDDGNVDLPSASLQTVDLPLHFQYRVTSK